MIMIHGSWDGHGFGEWHTRTQSSWAQSPSLTQIWPIASLLLHVCIQVDSDRQVRTVEQLPAVHDAKLATLRADLVHHVDGSELTKTQIQATSCLKYFFSRLGPV